MSATMPGELDAAGLHREIDRRVRARIEVLVRGCRAHAAGISAIVYSAVSRSASAYAPLASVSVQIASRPSTPMPLGSAHTCAPATGLPAAVTWPAIAARAAFARVGFALGRRGRGGAALRSRRRPRRPRGGAPHDERDRERGQAGRDRSLHTTSDNARRDLVAAIHILMTNA